VCWACSTACTPCSTACTTCSKIALVTNVAE
jgi:hypothetical protein